LLIESVADVITKPILFPMDEINAGEQWKLLKKIAK
jgi:hypothetical protein